MIRRRYGKEMAAVLPWAGAALLWFGLITPIRASEAGNLAEQSQIRRDRLEAGRQNREIQSLLARVKTALASSCGSSADPAALRERTIASTAGLTLSPFSLSVTGPPTPGAVVEAEGTRAVLLELLRRLGDPRGAGFLRSASIRDLGGRSAASAATAPFEIRTDGPIGTLPACDPPIQPRYRETAPRQEPSPPRATPRPVRPVIAEAAVVPTPHLNEPSAPLPPPFELVAFLKTEGRPRVSIRSGNQILVLSVGEQVEGWTCLSIDRDEGAVFEGAMGRRVVLRAGPGR